MYVLDRGEQKTEILAALSELKLGSQSSSAEFLRGRELLQELRAQLFNYETSLEYQAIKELMGQSFIGPDAYRDLLGATSVGTVPKFPAEITPELLKSDCPFTAGKMIKETHRLVFVPNTLDGEALTINSLRSCVAGSTDVFDDRYGAEWFRDQDFAQRASSQGEWVLAPMVCLPGSRSKTNSEQLSELEKHPEYRTAKALEVITALVMNELNNHERPLSECYGACEELTNGGATTSSGDRVCVGYFDAHGLFVLSRPDFRYAGVGRAVVRRLGN